MRYTRLLAPVLRDSLRDTPAVLLAGARQVGKTTLMRTMLPKDGEWRTLDNLATLEAAQRAPREFVQGLTRPAAIDEVQREPRLLLALKEAIDAERRPGSYILTGSSDPTAIAEVKESLSGRLAILRLWPLAEAELRDGEGRFIDAVFGSKPIQVARPIDRRALFSAIVRGGFPDAVKRGDAARREAWFADYVDTRLQTDARDLLRVGDPTALLRMLRMLAGSPASLANHADLARDAGIKRASYDRYLDVLRALHLIFELPSWEKNFRKRFVKRAKVCFVDTGLASYLQGVDVAGLEKRGTAFGPMVENFVACELAKLIGWSRLRPQLMHMRTGDDFEVDFVLEARDRRVVGIEVKASLDVTADDFRGLDVLAEAAGFEFHRGIILYAGRETLPFGPKLLAMPISALWA
jgi:predicted AAA+ superfamily ATPase